MFKQLTMQAQGNGSDDHAIPPDSNDPPVNTVNPEDIEYPVHPLPSKPPSQDSVPEKPKPKS